MIWEFGLSMGVLFFFILFLWGVNLNLLVGWGEGIGLKFGFLKMLFLNPSLFFSDGYNHVLRGLRTRRWGGVHGALCDGLV